MSVSRKTVGWVTLRGSVKIEDKGSWATIVEKTDSKGFNVV